MTTAIRGGSGQEALHAGAARGREPARVRLACPYCEPGNRSCDWCDDTGTIFADETERGDPLLMAAYELELCEPLQPLSNVGPGGSAPCPATIRQSTKTSPTSASSPSGNSDTASGSRGRSSPPASGSNRARSTLTRANSSQTNASAPKSTAAPQTPGVTGHG